MVRRGRSATGISQTLESFSETAARLGLTPTSDVLRAEEAPATLDEAEELGVAPGSPNFHLERVRRLDGVQVAVDVSFFRRSVAAISAVDFAATSLFRLLTEAGAEAGAGIRPSKRVPPTLSWPAILASSPARRFWRYGN